jgi:putative acetyltransferase
MTPPTVVIRPERAQDTDAVRALITAAFGAGAARDHHDDEPVTEALLNDRLRASSAWRGDLTLVADMAGTVVGQITCSDGVVQADDDPDRRAVVPAIGPVAVAPAVQRRGIGSSLLHDVMARARDAGDVALVLLGSPEFYGRFGFVPASEMGIRAPQPQWGNHFQVKVLRADVPVPAGRFAYAAPFDLM